MYQIETSLDNFRLLLTKHRNTPKNIIISFKIPQFFIDIDQSLQQQWTFNIFAWINLCNQ